jgi:hypothetical protein
MMSHCPRCGAALLPDASFCAACGASLTSSTGICPACRRPLSAEDRYCPACGAPAGTSADNDETIIQAAPARVVIEQRINPPPAAYTPPAYSPPPYVAAVYPPPSSASPDHSKTVWLVSCAGLLVLACLILAGAGLYLNRDRTPLAGWLNTGAMQTPGSPANTPGGAQATQSTEIKPISDIPIQFQPGKALEVEASGSPVTDEHGASLLVPSGAISGTAKVLLTPSEGSGPLAEALKSSYRLDTPFYSVAVQGENDAVGAAELSFPAPSPQSRLAVVIDQAYGGVLGIEPEGGRLRVKAHLGPEKMDTDPLNPSITRPTEIRYVVLTPKSAAQKDQPKAHITAGGSLPPFGRQIPAQLIPAPAKAALPAQNCHWLEVNSSMYSGCRRSATGLVHVYWTEDNPLTPAEVDPLIELVETDMKRYVHKGFTEANLTAYQIAYVVIEKDTSGPPLYSAKSGNVYIPNDTLKKITTPAEHFALMHELFHWIQDVKYTMNADALVNENAWWLDIAAENGVFLLEPEALTMNLKIYGQTEVKEGMLGLQSAPYLWTSKEESRYIQAQLLKVNMCDNTAECALSEKGFIQAINEGTFPISAEAAKANISRNIDDYARYFLGAPPLNTNTGIARSGPVKTGLGVGDYIFAYQRMPQDDFKILTSVGSPRITTNSSNLPAEIKATMEKDGLYTLRISNGGKTPAEESAANYESGYPLALTVADEVETWYREGNSDVKLKTAGQKLTIQPIHPTMGITVTRLAAVGKNEAKTFKAKLDVIDLSGDWLLTPLTVTNNTINCIKIYDDGSTAPDTSFKIENFPSIFGVLSIVMAMAGGYQAPHNPAQLEWVLDPSSSVMQQGGSNGLQGATLDSTVDIGKQDIRFKASFDKPTAQLLFPPRAAGESFPAKFPLPFACLGLFSAGGMALAIKHSRRGVAPILLVLAMLALAALACNLPLTGSIKDEGQFKKIEFVGKADKPEEPQWLLTDGTGKLDLDVTIQGDLESAGNALAELFGTDTNAPPPAKQLSTKCTGHAEFTMKGMIYKDGVITKEFLEKQRNKAQANP